MTDQTYDKKRPEGRPSKYDPAHCEALVQHMKEGASVASFAAEIDVARSTINAWAEDHPEFSEALSRGKSACAAWWEKQGRKVAENGGGPGQATMITFGLKNMGRDDWSDRQTTEISGPDGGPIRSQGTIKVEGLSESALREIAALRVEEG